MAAKVIYKKQELIIQPGITIRKAMEKLEINPVSVIPTKNGELIRENEIIQENDVIKLVAVISGG